MKVFSKRWINLRVPNHFFFNSILSEYERLYIGFDYLNQINMNINDNSETNLLV